MFFDILYTKLKKNGKLLITSVNNIWYPLLNFFETIGIKKISKKRVYTGLKKIKNILSANKFNFVLYNTRQFIPFKLFGFGNFLNLILEILFSKFNFGIKTYFLFQKISTINKDLSKTIIIPAKNEEKI